MPENATSKQLSGTKPTIKVQGRLPLFLLAILVLVTLLLPGRVWTTLLIGLAGLIAVAYFWARQLAGGLHDGTWIKLHQWALPEDITEGLKLIPRMLDTWEFIANRRD